MVIKFIVGLGNNIGCQYLGTRHNLGARYVKLLADKYGVFLSKNRTLCGYVGSVKLFGNVVRLLIPDSYINKSGMSVSKCVNCFRLNMYEILVVHDDLDLLPGKVRIRLGNKKIDSHRGVKDIISSLNNKSDFYRLRIGIGRPVLRNEIVDFVLSPPLSCEMDIIDRVLYKAIDCIEDIVMNNFITVMNQLHSY